MNKTQAEGMLVGLAVGDALGAPVEFGYTARMIKGDWSGEMQDHRIPAGYYTDDTAMALCLADSLLEVGGYNSYDVMAKYLKWATQGYRDSEGDPASDIGSQTARAIEDFVKYPNVYEDEPRGEGAGNGGIMRLAPAIIAAHDEDVHTARKIARMTSRETHYSEEADAGAELFGAILHNALHMEDKKSIVTRTDFASSDAYVSIWSRVMDVLKPDFNPKTLEDVGGYVVDSIKIAVWSFVTFDSFRQGLIEVIRLGGDTDTNGAIYGQLAGAYYGYEAIPANWLNDLHMLDEIIKIADRLYDEQPSKIVATRFEEDGAYFKEFNPEG